MINSIETYKDAGTKAGQARKHKDEATAKHFISWYNKAVYLETPPDRKAAQNAFNEAYREAATPGFNPFP